MPISPSRTGLTLPGRLDPSEILNRRLFNTGLAGSPFQGPADAIAHLGAVQAQDFAAAKWSLGLRVKNSTDAGIEKAFNDGAILRTHVLRPTWHFVLPEDVRWMTALTAAGVKTTVASSNRKIGLTSEVFTKSNAAIAEALKGQTTLTRQELKAVLAEIGIVTDVRQLAHIIMQAELDGLICSGPKRGKQFTYALIEDRVKKSRELDRKESLELLARRYFSTHGPAQLKDFSWWSGLSLQDAKAGLDAIRPEMNEATAGGRTLWSFPAGELPGPQSPTGFLLSIYDEYVIAYRDRSDISSGRGIERMIARGNALTAVIVLNGNVAGTWRREVTRRSIAIRLSPFRRLERDEREAVDAAAARYGKFTGIPVVVTG